jgi:predicted dehydrogenase
MLARMVNRSRVRVGVVGCGLVAQVMHLPHLRELVDRFTVTAVCDLASGPLAFAGAMFPQARRLTAWEDVLGEVDAVLVLTAGSHAPVAVAAAEAGLHVFVEKPMCFSVEEGEEMIASAHKHGVVLMVGYMKRYDPSYEALQQALDGVTFARITTLESPIEPYALHHPLSERTPLDPEIAARLAADDERRLRAGLGVDDPLLLRTYKSVLLDSMVHELNGVRGLLGEPDALHSARIFEGGVTVNASFGGVETVFAWVDLPGIARYAQDWSFYGPDRRATLEFPSPLLRSHPTRLVYEEGEPGGVVSRRSEHVVSYEEPFKRELLEFHAAIAEGRAPRTPGEDGLRDVALCRDIVLAHAA